MKTIIICCLLSCCFLLLLGGCAASSDQTDKTASVPPPPPASKGTAPGASKGDTVSVADQKVQKPSYEQTDQIKTSVPPSASVRYCVQVGAYKLRENADVVAGVAKGRFAKSIYTIHDAATGLFKVMVGDFTAKDDARLFRDRMVQQYPGDYKDAWVSELTQ